MATNQAVCIYSVAPFSVVRNRPGKVQIFDIFHNIFAIGDGAELSLWDDLSKVPLATISFSRQIHALKVRAGRLLVVFQKTILIYAIRPNLVKLAAFDISLNNYPVFDANDDILAVCARKVGHIKLINLQCTCSLYLVPTDICTCIPKVTAIIAAHASPIASISISPCAKLIATASQTGTLIRVYRNTEKCFEFRRGVDSAVIYSLAFNSTSTKLCASSDKGTVHIFLLATKSKSVLSDTGQLFNRQSALVGVPNFSKYFDSDWSFASISTSATQKSRVGFMHDDSQVVMVTSDGGLFILGYDIQRGGKGEIISYRSLGN